MKITFKQTWRAVYRNPAGEIVWTREVKNLVPNEMLNSILNGVGFANALYVGLVDNAGFTAYAAGDTAAEIGGTNQWAESTDYSETVRQDLTLSTATAESRDNTGNEAIFTMAGTGTIRGLFAASSNVKAGTAGYLAGEVDFGGGSQAYTPGGTLTVGVTITAASA
jgi:hypothetical protein